MLAYLTRKETIVTIIGEDNNPIIEMLDELGISPEQVKEAIGEIVGEMERASNSPMDQTQQEFLMCLIKITLVEAQIKLARSFQTKAPHVALSLVKTVRDGSYSIASCASSLVDLIEGDIEKHNESNADL